MGMTELHVQFRPDEAKQLLWLLNRAVATLQPEKWPPITEELIKHVEKFVNKQESDDGTQHDQS